MVKRIAMAALMALSLPAAAQSYQRAHEQLFCNILGGYAVDSVNDYYNHVPLDQSLRRIDSFVCTDSNREVCKQKMGMIEDNMRHWYSFAQKRGYESLDAATFNTLADTIGSTATSVCWNGAKRAHGW